MEIILHQQIQLQGSLEHGTYADVHKSIDSNIAPRLGDYISDSAYEDIYEYEVTQVVIDYSLNQCRVYIKPLALDSTEKEVLKEQAEIMEMHGWTCPRMEFL